MWFGVCHRSHKGSLGTLEIGVGSFGSALYLVALPFGKRSNVIENGPITLGMSRRDISSLIRSGSINLGRIRSLVFLLGGYL